MNIFLDSAARYASTAQCALMYTMNNGASRVSDGAFPSGVAFGHHSGIGVSSPRRLTLSQGYQELILGCRMKLTNTNVHHIFQLEEGGTTHVNLRSNSNGRLEVRLGESGTLLCEGTTQIELGVVYHVELRAKIHDTEGSILVRLNGVEEASFSGDTRNGGAQGVITRLTQTGSGGSGGGAARYDDIYINDPSGSFANDFLGEVRVAVLRPVADGNHKDFTPSTGSDNYARVQQPDGDDNYVSSASVGAMDTYEMSELPSAASVIPVIRVGLLARKDDAGGRTGKAVVRIGGTNHEGPEFSLLDSYRFIDTAFHRNPNGDVAWTDSALHTAEIGAKVHG